MTKTSPEKQFYQRHYGTGLTVSTDETLRQTKEAYFLPGKRYHLIEKILDENTAYGSLLEIGCAQGECLLYLAQKYKFNSVIGVDIALPDEVITSLNGVRFIQANSNEALPIDNESVDVLVAMMVIEHLFDPFHAFSEIKRLLSCNGIAVINLPLVTSIKNRFRLLSGRLPTTSVDYDRWFSVREWDGNHLHYFSVESINRLALECGLEVSQRSAVGNCYRLKTLFPSFLANELTLVLTHRR